MTSPHPSSNDEGVDVFMNWVRGTHAVFSQSSGDITLNERRVRLLFAALHNLYLECLAAGHTSDRDFNWPRVMQAAKEALNR